MLTDADLTALASGLRAGRLSAPFNATSLQRYCPADHASGVAARLQLLHQEGMQPRHQALVIETIIKTRSLESLTTEVVDLVWTGPETRGIANRETGVVVRDLFTHAEKEVLVVGFAVYQGRTIFKDLAERMEQQPALQVKLFLDVQRHVSDTSLAEEVVRRFLHRFRAQEWPGQRLPELYYDPRSLELEAGKRSSLHAKCIVVDRKVALVTSANFTEAAQFRNIEVGALIRSEPFALRLAEHFLALIDAGLLRRTELGSSHAGE